MNCASRCAPRARGPLSRPVAMSLAREDYTTMPRWRARARIVPFFSRERPVQTRKPSVTSGSGRGFCLAQARAQEVKKAAYASFSASNGTRSILLVLSPPPAKIPAARPRGRRLRALAPSCRPGACGRRCGPVRWHTGSMDGGSSRRLLVGPSRVVTLCHGWRRSSRHACSLCSSCAPLAEGLHHMRLPSTAAQHRPAPPGRRVALRADRRR